MTILDDDDSKQYENIYTRQLKEVKQELHMAKIKNKEMAIINQERANHNREWANYNQQQTNYNREWANYNQQQEISNDYDIQIREIEVLLVKSDGENYRADNDLKVKLEELRVKQKADEIELEKFKLELESKEKMLSMNHAHLQEMQKLQIARPAQQPDTETSIAEDSLHSRLPATDKGHLFITGGSGSGKSTIFKTIYKHHLESDKKGIIVIDPHGELSEELMQLSPDSDHITYFNAKEKGNVFNPFDIPKGVLDDKTRLESTVKSILSALSNIWASDALSGAMTTYLMPYIEIMLLEPHGSFKGILEMLNDGVSEYESNHPDLTGYIKEDNNEQTVLALKVRFKSLLRGSLFERITTGRSTINLQELTDEGGIIIFNLHDAPKIEAIGQLVISQMLEIALSRDETSEVATFMLIDEAHRFNCNAISRAYSETRKFNLFLSLATQYPDQIKPTVLRKSVINNSHYTINAYKTETGFRTTIKHFNNDPCPVQVDMEYIKPIKQKLSMGESR